MSRYFVQEVYGKRFSGVNPEASDEIGSWSISTLSVGPFGYCSYSVIDDNIKRLMK